jgi:hypothetical protein
MVGVLALCAIVGSGLASARPGSQTPPGGVYTCAWINAHPQAAAAAQVTCDPSVFATAIASSGLGGFSTGLASPTMQASPPSPDGLDSTGCQDVPTSGAVGQGVFAWTSFKYSTYWQWAQYDNGGSASYTFYIQTPPNNTVTDDYIDSFDTHDTPSGLPANDYRWGAQNHSSDAATWWACWSD